MQEVLTFFGLINCLFITAYFSFLWTINLNVEYFSPNQYGQYCTLYLAQTLKFINYHFLFCFFADGQNDVKVQLVVKKYIEKGGSVALQCNHNVKPEILYKVRVLTSVLTVVFKQRFFHTIWFLW